MADRYALLGLARARATWFRSVAHWTNSAALPAEFTKCVSAEELRALLAAPRPFSAVLLDAGLPAVDRDLVAAAREAGAAVLIVSDGHDARDWVALGAAAVLPAELRREVLLDALATHTTMVGGDRDSGERQPPAVADVEEGPLVAVTGPGGTGASTAAMALAQGLAARSGQRPGAVVLADLCRHAEQAMLHDVRDVFPGIQELVEGHRGGQMAAADVHALTFALDDRGYALLLGLRRARYWAALRPRALAAAVRTLRRTYATVVCDVDGDFEGEDEGGSLDVEERNAMARTAVDQAALVLAVGRPGPKGLHALVRVLGDLAAVGVQPERILPVINFGPRAARARGELVAAVSALARPVVGEVGPTPLFLPRRKLDQALHDGVPLPPPLPALLAGSVAGLLERLAAPVGGERSPAPKRVVPGSLGSWSEEATG